MDFTGANTTATATAATATGGDTCQFRYFASTGAIRDRFIQTAPTTITITTTTATTTTISSTTTST